MSTGPDAAPEPRSDSATRAEAALVARLCAGGRGLPYALIVHDVGAASGADGCRTLALLGRHAARIVTFTRAAEAAQQARETTWPRLSAA